MTDRQTVGRTDGRTDGILIARPRLHFMQRGKNRSMLTELFEKSKKCDFLWITVYNYASLTFNAQFASCLTEHDDDNDDVWT